MRRILLALVLMTLGVPLLASAAFKPCTYSGTDKRDVVTGNDSSEVFCLRSGNDYTQARGGNDIIQGDGGADTIIGGDGHDTLEGAKGKDYIFAVDGKGGDKVYGGGQLDHCYIDQGDQEQGCHVFFGYSPAMAKALLRIVGDLIQIVENRPTVTVSPTPVTVTQTITQTVTIVTPPPDCQGNPAPPPIC